MKNNRSVVEKLFYELKVCAVVQNFAWSQLLWSFAKKMFSKPAAYLWLAKWWHYINNIAWEATCRPNQPPQQTSAVCYASFCPSTKSSFSEAASAESLISTTFTTAAVKAYISTYNVPPITTEGHWWMMMMRHGAITIGLFLSSRRWQLPRRTSVLAKCYFFQKPNDSLYVLRALSTGRNCFRKQLFFAGELAKINEFSPRCNSCLFACLAMVGTRRRQGA